MATRLWAVVFDSPEPEALARWWAEAVGWDLVTSTEYHAEVRCPDDPDAPRLGFERVGGKKVVKNRVHLDLSSSSIDDQAATVDSLRRKGATVAHSPTWEIPWVVLADPEGNELCVLEPRNRYIGIGSVAAIVVDVADPMAIDRFYAAATGWVVSERTADVVSLHRPNGRLPDLDLVRVPDVKSTKNRVHLDVAPSGGTDTDTDTEAARLCALGALAVDVGQGPTASWRVMADPQGNELCLLSER